LIKICINNGKLNYLNLTWCTKITDNGVVEGIGKMASNLTLLGFFGNTNITNDAYHAVKDRHGRSLLTIDFYGCIKIDDELKTLESLKQNF